MKNRVNFSSHFISTWDIYSYQASPLNITHACHSPSLLLPIFQDPTNIITSPMNFPWQFQPTLCSTFLKYHCSCKSLYHKIWHLIIYCLVLFSICVMNIFSPMLYYNFSAKDLFSCLSVSHSAFRKYRHMIDTQ